MSARIKLEELSKDELIDIILEKDKKIKKLEKELGKYENPHTPPSKDERKSRTNCPKCNKHNKPKEIREKIYEEIPEPQPTKVVKTRWGYYECDCGHCWESKPEQVPEKGLFGKNAQTHIVLLKWDDRLPLRKTVSALERQFGLTLTSKAIYDITKRVADKVTQEYIKIRREIRRAKHLNIDETKIKIQGVWYYVWVFRSRKYILFVIRRERNQKVLDEVLGHHYRGSITCDGLSAYEEYTKYLQRCWAHILRETKEYAEKYDDAKPMHNWMEDLFGVVKSVSIKYPLIKNGLPYWFTRILHPVIKPTNNGAEQPLREIKVIQKIIGTLRNEDGARIMETIMTLLASWKLQKKNNFTELRSLL